MARGSASPHRLLFFATCAIALIAGCTACGAGNDASPGDSAAAKTTTTETAPTTDEGRIRALVARVHQAFTTGDGEAICDSLSKRGQRDLVTFGNATALPGGCFEVADGIVKRELDAGTEQRPTKVLSVRVRDDRAVALIKVTGAAAIQQRYVKEDGAWKIGSFNLSAAVGGGS